MGESLRSMRLSPFIHATLEQILQEFEEFARTHTTAGEAMDMSALRDHAGAMLTTIARDMNRPQSAASGEIKSKGDAPEVAGVPETAAEQHGSDRADSGFSLEEMFSEYRALRASVLRLWIKAREALDETDLHDLIRFNEAIDQALAESITSFSEGLGQSRDMFLAILGHDLRNPLGGIVTASSFLATDGGLSGRNLKLAQLIAASGMRMGALVDDLIDFTRSRLGRGIPVVTTETDLAAIGRGAVEEIQAMHPTTEFRLDVFGDVRGQWDAGRVSQALGNLIANAVQHGAEDTPIVVAARGAADEVVISIHNHGRVIAPEDQRRIFDPFEILRSARSDREEKAGIGLGLYIAQQIAVAHGGSVGVRSSVGEGTTFQLRLPRLVAA